MELCLLHPTWVWGSTKKQRSPGSPSRYQPVSCSTPADRGEAASPARSFLWKMRNKPQSSREGAREGWRGNLRSLTSTRDSPKSWLAIDKPAVLPGMALVCCSPPRYLPTHRSSRDVGRSNNWGIAEEKLRIRGCSLGLGPGGIPMEELQLHWVVCMLAAYGSLLTYWVEDQCPLSFPSPAGVPVRLGHQWLLCLSGTAP